MSNRKIVETLSSEGRQQVFDSLMADTGGESLELALLLDEVQHAETGTGFIGQHFAKQPMTIAELVAAMCKLRWNDTRSVRETLFMDVEVENLGTDAFAHLAHVEGSNMTFPDNSGLVRDSQESGGVCPPDTYEPCSIATTIRNIED